jgi:hypothetical protein
MPLIDFYGKFAKSTVTCRHCGWTGKGADMTNGEGFGDGVVITNTRHSIFVLSLPIERGVR